MLWNPGRREKPMARFKLFGFSWGGSKKIEHINADFHPYENPTKKQPIGENSAVGDIKWHPVIKGQLLELGSKEQDSFWGELDRYLAELISLRQENRGRKK